MQSHLYSSIYGSDLTPHFVGLANLSLEQINTCPLSTAGLVYFWTRVHLLSIFIRLLCGLYSLFIEQLMIFIDDITAFEWAAAVGVCTNRVQQQNSSCCTFLFVRVPVWGRAWGATHKCWCRVMSLDPKKQMSNPPPSRYKPTYNLALVERKSSIILIRLSDIPNNCLCVF